MLFDSWEFLIFFAVVLALYFQLRGRSRIAFLAGASYFFYGWWDWRFLLLIWVSTLVDFFAARAIFAQRERGASGKPFLLLSLFANLGILAGFKYLNFFVESATACFDVFGFRMDAPTLHVVLPVGISFYTFQTMSYTIDVYRGKLEPTRDPLLFAVYVCYFPQLVAGPIERADKLLPGLARPEPVDVDRLRRGLLLIALGFLKKTAIADAVAPYVEETFRAPEAANGWMLLQATYLFALQIYCDFSGYSDIARGVSRLLGIELCRNFEQPYFSRSVTEFWRRWHMSLSFWLRDYLYFSLGGNRLGRLRTSFNLIVTMLLGGLWHGAGWTFVIWGGLHGVYLSLEKLRSRGRSVVADQPLRLGRSLPLDCIRIFVTFHLVAFSWILFRAESLDHAVRFLQGFSSFPGSASVAAKALFPPIAFFAVLFFVEWPQYRSGRHTAVSGWALPLRVGVYAAMLLFFLFFGSLRDQTPFIYFQF